MEVSEHQAETEQWRPVIGFEGAYEVSDLGRVRSLDRRIICRNGTSFRRRGVVLNPSEHTPGGGYRQVKLPNPESPNPRAQRAVFVHTLVLTAFVGPRPSPEIEVRHLNGVRSDNRLSNLAWGTASENAYDRVRHGTHPNANKMECDWGHVLEPPNLYERGLLNGQRLCRACAQTRAHLLHDRGQRDDDTFRVEAARQYARILAGEVRPPSGERTMCPRGHLLQEPNLVAWSAARGHRGCLACSRARARVHAAKQRGEELDLRVESDRKYAQIMRTVS